MPVRSKTQYIRSSVGDVGDSVLSFMYVPFTGVMVAECEAEYAGVTYPPNTPFSVEMSDMSGDRTTVVFYATIQDVDFVDYKVTINGDFYETFWAVHRRKHFGFPEKYTKPVAVGSTYGELKNITTNVSYPFVESADVIDNVRDQAVLDKHNNVAWIFGIGTVKINCPSELIDVVSTPRWSFSEVPARTFVVCKNHVIEYANGQVQTTKSLPYDVLSVSGYIDNRLVCLSNGRIFFYDFDSNTTQLVVDQIDGNGIADVASNVGSIVDPIAEGTVFSAPDGSIVYYTSAMHYGCELLYQNENNEWNLMLFDLGRYSEPYKFEITDGFLFVADKFHTGVHRISTGDKSVVFNPEFHTPSGVTYDEVSGNIYVSFFDSSIVKVYSQQFQLIEEIDTGINNNGITYSDGNVFVTNIFSDVVSITEPLPKLEDSSSTSFAQSNYGFTDPLPRTESIVKASDYWSTSFSSVSVLRPSYFFASTRSKHKVYINGVEFSQGWIFPLDTVEVYYQGVLDYEYSYNLSLIGTQSLRWQGVTENKLFPDLVVLDQLAGAKMNEFYYEMFTVEGITDDLLTDLTSDGVVLEFLINPDLNVPLEDYDFYDFNTTGQIKNGDVVLVRARIKNMFPAREPYYMYSNSEQVVSWIILPILLEGTEVRHRESEAIDRTAHIWLEHNRQESTYTIDSMLGDLSDYSSALSYMMGSGGVNSSVSLSEFDYPDAELNANVTVQYYGDTVWGDSLATTTFATDVSSYDYYIAAKIADFDRFAFESTVPVSYFDSESLYNQYSAGGTSPEIDLTFSKLSTNVKQLFIDAEFQISERALPKYSPIPVLEILKPDYNFGAYIGMLYFKNVYVKQVSIDTLEMFSKQDANVSFYFEGFEFDKLSYTVGVGYSGIFEALKEGTQLYFSMYPERLVVGGMQYVNSPDFEVLKRNVFNGFSLDAEKRILSIAAEVFTSAEKLEYSVNKVDVGGYLVIHNTYKFANGSQSLGYGGFLTEEQARTYAQSLGFTELNSVVFQLDGGWIFRSNVGNDDLVCSIVSTPDGGVTHKFGYIHGG